MALFEKLGNYKDCGLLIIRVGVGLSVALLDGLPKITGGIDTWTKVGGAMGHLGIHFMPTFWGFMASASEALGGILIVLGLFFRPACMFVAFTMFVAAFMHLSAGDGMGKAAHAFELLMVFLGLIFIGPGKYSVDRK